MMPAPPVSLAPGELEAKHKRELRRQIALHYVQRRVMTDDYALHKRITEALQRAQEERARLEDQLAAQKGTSAAAATLQAQIKALEHRIEELATSYKVGAALQKVSRERTRALALRQGAESYKLGSRVEAELKKGAHVHDEKGSGEKSGGGAGGGEEEEGAGGSGAGASAASGSAGTSTGTGTPLAGTKRPREEDGEEEREADSAGEGGDGGEGEEGGGASASSRSGGGSGSGSSKKRKDDKRRGSSAKEEADKIAAKFAGLKACHRCGSHVHRSLIRKCRGCARELCDRGGKTVDDPNVWPCVQVETCRCGVNMCTDCLLGSASRAGTRWSQCLRCEWFMCPRELHGAAARCGECKLYPLCKQCRRTHGDDCTHVAPEGWVSEAESEDDSEEEDEEEEEEEEDSDEDSDEEEDEEEDDGSAGRRGRRSSKGSSRGGRAASKGSASKQSARRGSTGAARGGAGSSTPVESSRYSRLGLRDRGAVNYAE